MKKLLFLLREVGISGSAIITLHSINGDLSGSYSFKDIPAWMLSTDVDRIKVSKYGKVVDAYVYPATRRIIIGKWLVIINPEDVDTILYFYTDEGIYITEMTLDEFVSSKSVDYNGAIKLSDNYTLDGTSKWVIDCWRKVVR